MPKPTGAEPERASASKKLTVRIDLELWTSVQLVALWRGKFQYEIVEEALRDLVQRYRAEREAERKRMEAE